MKILYILFILPLSILLWKSGLEKPVIITTLAVCLILLYKNNLANKRTYRRSINLQNQIEARENTSLKRKVNYNRYYKESYKKKLPTSDLKIKKTDLEAKYLIKTLRYVKNNEPKWPHANWSKTYREEIYNIKITRHLIQIFGNKCCYRGKSVSVKNITIDHISPRQKGGSNRINNLLLSCINCNSRKGTKNIGKFILDQYTFGEKLSPWFNSVIKNKVGRNLLKALI